jgi:hypothetical protein
MVKKESVHKTFLEKQNVQIFFTSGLSQLQAFEESMGRFAHCRD